MNLASEKLNQNFKFAKFLDLKEPLFKAFVENTNYTKEDIKVLCRIHEKPDLPLNIYTTNKYSIEQLRMVEIIVSRSEQDPDKTKNYTTLMDSKYSATQMDRLSELTYKNLPTCLLKEPVSNIVETNKLFSVLAKSTRSLDGAIKFAEELDKKHNTNYAESLKEDGLVKYKIDGNPMNQVVSTRTQTPSEMVVSLHKLHNEPLPRYLEPQLNQTHNQSKGMER